MMKKSVWQQMLQSRIWKLVGVLLLCLSGSGIFLTAIALDIDMNSARGDTHLNEDLQSIFESQMYSSVPQPLRAESWQSAASSLSKENSNLRIRVSSITDLAMTTLVDTRQDGETYYEGFVGELYWQDGQGITSTEVHSVSEARTILWDIDGVHECILVLGWLRKPMPVHDMYWFTMKAAAIMTWLDSYPVVSMSVCIIVFVLALIYEFSAAGHSAKQEEIAPAWIDAVPFDLLTVLWLITESGVAPVFYSPLGSNLPGYFVADLGLMAMALLFFFWLMSLARHWKRKDLVSNLLIVRLIHWLLSLSKKFGWLPVASWMILGIIGFSLLRLAAWEMSGAGLLLLGVVSVLLWSVQLYELWGSSIICKSVAEYQKGDLSYRIEDQKLKHLYGKLGQSARQVNDLGSGLEKAVEERLRTERLRTELITNVSHDIKTPLTSIVNYVDLLQKEHTPQQETQYLEVLQRQSQRLKKLTEDVLESSKAESGNIEVHIESVSVVEIVEQAMAEYQDRLEAASLTMVIDTDHVPHVSADGRLLWRVLRNLLSNVSKYAMEGTRVYLDAHCPDPEHVEIDLKNISRSQLNISSNELMERFVRGDSSRHTEGSGLGLNISESLVRLMGGDFHIEIDGDLFKAVILLKKA